MNNVQMAEACAVATRMNAQDFVSFIGNAELARHLLAQSTETEPAIREIVTAYTTRIVELYQEAKQLAEATAEELDVLACRYALGDPT